MQIYFCERCGRRVSDVDLEKGRGVASGEAVYCEECAAEAGVDVYAVSPENEPEWPQWYVSCVYTPEEMRDVIIALGQRFETEGLDTKILPSRVRNPDPGPTPTALPY